MTAVIESSHVDGDRQTTVPASGSGDGVYNAAPDNRQTAHSGEPAMTDLSGWKPVALADDDDEIEGDDEDDDEDE